MATLVEQIREKVRSQYCRQDAPQRCLPPERELVKQFDVSRATVRQALADLTEEGLLERYPGRGTFLTDRVAADEPGPTAEARSVSLICQGLRVGETARGAHEAIDYFAHRNTSTVVSLSGGEEVCEVEHIQRALQQRAAGLLIQPSQSVHSRLLRRRVAELRRQAPAPIVLLDESDLIADDVTRVSLDNRRVGRDATEHLIDRGHRRIAHIGCGISPVNRRRTQGFHDAMARAGLAVPSPYTIDIGSVPRVARDYEMGREAARWLLALAQRPTAVFCYWDEIALGIVLEALHQGLRVPEDLAVIGVSHLRDTSLPLAPMGISTIWFDNTARFRRGAEALFQEITGQAPSGRQIAIPHKLVAAASTLGT